MSEKNITFEDLPRAMSWLMDKLNELDSKIDGLNNQNQSVPTEQWMNLKELCEYIPSHPAEQTVYGWTSCHLIPFHKRGKRVMFLKSHWRLLKSVNAKLLNSVFMLVTRFSGLQTLSHFSNDYIGVGALKLGSPIFHECRTIHFQPDC